MIAVFIFAVDSMKSATGKPFRQGTRETGYSKGFQHCVPDCNPIKTIDNRVKMLAPPEL